MKPRYQQASHQRHIAALSLPTIPFRVRVAVAAVAARAGAAAIFETALSAHLSCHNPPQAKYAPRRNAPQHAMTCRAVVTPPPRLCMQQRLMPARSPPGANALPACGESGLRACGSSHAPRAADQRDDTAVRSGCARVCVGEVERMDCGTVSKVKEVRVVERLTAGGDVAQNDTPAAVRARNA